MAVKMMGAQVKRKEDPRLITGASTYTGDISMPGLHYVAFVRSPHAHARIRRIDAAAVLKRPGVVAVVTGADLKPHCGPVPVDQASTEGGEGQAAIGRKHYPLAIERVRHVGEAVAAVIAATEELAVDARRRRRRRLGAAARRERSAGGPEARRPQVHADAPGNVEHENRITAGDTDAAFASAFKVVRQRMVSQRLCGVPLEGRATLAAPDSTTGGLVVWATTQAPHAMRNGLATLLGLEQNQIRVIAPEVGGGFGVKFGVYPEDAALAAMAKLHRLPLRWVETRVEHMVATTHGRAHVTDVEAAVERDGTITALRVHVLADIGAYPIFTFIPDLALMMGVGVYRIPNVDLRSTCVFTNTTPVAAYRGAGRPEGCYYIERIVDLAAQELGVPPETVRRRNFIAPDAFPYTTPTGQRYDSGEYDRALTKALQVSKYDALRKDQAARLARGDRKLLGIGIACYVEMCGFGPFESAIVRVEPSGTVTAYTGTSAHGQGHETTFAQIIADHLGVAFDQIVVRHGDTSNTPMGNGTGGSRSLAVGGTSILRATLKVQEHARAIAAHVLEAAKDDVVFDDGRYQVKGVPARALTLAQIAGHAYGDKLPDGDRVGARGDRLLPAAPAPLSVRRPHRGRRDRPRDGPGRGAGLRVGRRLRRPHEPGPRRRPGARRAGAGHRPGAPRGARLRGRRPAGDGLADGLLRAARGRPPVLRTDQTVTPTPVNPLGAKGIGEAATIGSTPAVVNAVVDALRSFKVRHIDMPLRPERVWQAMQDGRP